MKVRGLVLLFLLVALATGQSQDTLPGGSHIDLDPRCRTAAAQVPGKVIVITVDNIKRLAPKRSKKPYSIKQAWCL
jgi:hypothetical protein